MNDQQTINTHNLLVEFGKHKGERWTRIPVSYLKWLINEGTQYAPIAEAELKRRGTNLEWKLELSSHAIDRASLRCRKIWHETAIDKEEGIYTWLHRIASEALELHPNEEKINYKGLKLVFEFGEYYPNLKTVMPD